jgi:hypothetical protein
LYTHTSKLLVRSRQSPCPRKTNRLQKRALRRRPSHSSTLGLLASTPPTSGALLALRCRIAAAGLHTLAMDPRLGMSSTGGRTIQLGYAPAPDWSLILTSGSLLAVEHPPRQLDSKFLQHISATAFGLTKREAYDNAAFLLDARLRLPDYPAVVSKPKSETRSQLRARYHDMKDASQLYVFGQGLVVSQPSKPHKASSVRGADGAARPAAIGPTPTALSADAACSLRLLSRRRFEAWELDA